jgi:hypothetical protein
MPTLKEFESWLSAAQVMELTGYSEQGVLNLAEERRIRAVRTSLGWLFDPQSVEMFLEPRSSTPPPAVIFRELHEEGREV